MPTVTFDQTYYERLMHEFGYDPLLFGKIDFSLGSLTDEDLQRRWLCHHGGRIFADHMQLGQPGIVTTGFGLSGIPHAGSLSQILRSIALQRGGIPIQIVLGDLDAYNGKAKPLAEARELADKYKEFILALGFDPSLPSRLRAQYDKLEVLRTAYLIGHYMDDHMFNEAEEDLHAFYTARGKVDTTMSYRRKLSLNLMTADFIHLHTSEGFQNILVMLGIDEHKYVRFAQETATRMATAEAPNKTDMTLGGLYSPLIKGFFDYPKMSKSFPESGIRADMSPDNIVRRIMEGEGNYNKPENNVVYQMMAGASWLTPHELKEMYTRCLTGGRRWERAKRAYTDMLVEICSRWPAK